VLLLLLLLMMMILLFAAPCENSTASESGVLHIDTTAVCVCQ
jgi:hypothetical protein